ncbi:carboxynorspermidine decarboxylase [Scatolibacter rhodanostii]|uniref:carboxynorspermidine decarboxylase n=1 Tax=Scatolibacter rhodanostii TaxID=2014781 RepID=UPI000C07E741|nr:carboxynorspermidine decarboxylase [Scatolibacter rhodanostii]
MTNDFRTPYFLVEEELLVRNLKILKSVSDVTGCKILLAQKAFSMYATYPLLAQYLDGTTASGLHEAKLGAEEFGKETHVFSPAYREDEFEELLQYADHFSFNSPSQVKQFAQRARELGKSVGLRLNPECSTQEGHDIYDPCAFGSRLGTTLAQFDESILPLLDGLHFHTLCEQDSDALEVTVTAVEERFGKYLHGMKWLNLGGGHHITKAGYNLERLIGIIQHLQKTYQLQVYLEPGEAVVLNAGFLVTKVLDVVHNGIDIAILDTSAACHMPDVLEMPYLPPLQKAGKVDEKAFTFRLAGPTCLTGDVIGDYSFDGPLKIGDTLVFEDMALYTMVKTNTFNGMNLPSIVYRRQDKTQQLIRSFSYEDFKTRLS